MEHEKLERINALAKKKKTVGLTESELSEQQELYKEYIAEIRASFGMTLDSTVVVRPDGTREPFRDRKDQKNPPPKMEKKV